MLKALQRAHYLRIILPFEKVTAARLGAENRCGSNSRILRTQTRNPTLGIADIQDERPSLAWYLLSHSV